MTSATQTPTGTSASTAATSTDSSDLQLPPAMASTPMFDLEDSGPVTATMATSKTVTNGDVSRADPETSTPKEGWRSGDKPFDEMELVRALSRRGLGETVATP